MNPNGSVLLYSKDGAVTVKNVTGKPDSKRKRMVLTDSETGDKRTGYCVEYDAKLRSRTDYTSTGPMTDTLYFGHLPADVKNLILAATYYGENGSNKLPAAGVNSDDYYFATQAIIWEAQQQIRVFDRDAKGRVKGTKLVSAHGMPGDYFYRYVKGRSAEKCYNFMVENIDRHFLLPAFAGESADKAKAVMLKYSMETKKWHGFADDEGMGFDIKWNNEELTYSKEGDMHFFTSEAPVKGEKIIKLKRKNDKGSSAENLLIWNCNANKNFQTIATGSASPAEVYMKVKTDIPSEATIQKQDSETGKVVPLEGTQYKVKCVDIDKYVSKDMENPDGDIYSTGKDGRVTIGEKLQAGNYILEEVKAPKGYVVAKDNLKFVVDGNSETIEVVQENIPQKGIIIINKVGEYKYKEEWADIREKAMGGIDFDIIALADIVTPDGTVRAHKGDVVDTVRTDFNGNVSTDKLYLGPYNVVEKDAPMEYRISDPINVALVYSGQDTEIVEKEINILNRLKRNTDSFGNTPKTGDYDNINFAVIVMLMSLTLIAVVVTAHLARRKE